MYTGCFIAIFLVLSGETTPGERTYALCGLVAILPALIWGLCTGSALI
jgi:hypothetical protein